MPRDPQVGDAPRRHLHEIHEGPKRRCHPKARDLPETQMDVRAIQGATHPQDNGHDDRARTPLPRPASRSQTARPVRIPARNLHLDGSRSADSGRRLLQSFIHGDFLPRNICPDWSNGTVYYLDNDRTKRHAIPQPFFLKRRNLAQFCFNLYLLAEQPVEPLIEAMVEAYAAELGWPDSRRSAETETIKRQVNRRWSLHKTGELRRKHEQQNKL